MIRTRVGYTGGKQKNPTYQRIGDHTEALQVDFDPKVISYAQLLAIFWRAHSPEAKEWSRQYKAAVFYHDAQQKQAALQSKAALEKKMTVHTEVLPASTFTLAEDYHQKYQLRNSRVLMQDFSRFYPDARAFTRSTAAARINGLLGGYGSRSAFDAIRTHIGLSPQAEKALLDSLTRRQRSH